MKNISRRSLVASGLALGFLACTGAAFADEKPQTVSEGILTMGTNAAFPPYEFYEGDTIVGIDAEIAAAIAEKLGLTLEIQDMDFGSIITAVQTGKIDMGMAGMTVTEERLQNVNFSQTYASGIQVIIVPEGSEIDGPDYLFDHEEMLIGVQENTTGHIYCSDDYGEDRVTAYTNGATAVQALLAGKVDCVIIDNEPAKNYVAANEGLTILETEYVTEDYAICVNKDNASLLEAIDGALKELTDDGTVEKVLAKYIGDGEKKDASYADGTYEAAYNGIGGKVPVTVTIEGGVITAVEIGDNSETQGIGSKAIEALPELIVAANGTEGVDAYSGASVTSSAIFKGVTDCLEQAQA